VWRKPSAFLSDIVPGIEAEPPAEFAVVAGAVGCGKRERERELH
jgi:hypothetical protein